MMVWNMKKKKKIFVYFEAWKNELVCYMPTQSLFLFAELCRRLSLQKTDADFSPSGGVL